MAHLLSQAIGKCSRRRDRRLPLRAVIAAKRASIHPGEILLLEFLEPLELSQYRLAKDISVPPRRIKEIVHGKRSVTADTALRLARYFGTTEACLMNLQARYDLEVQRDELGNSLERDVAVLERERLGICPSAPADETPCHDRCFGSIIERGNSQAQHLPAKGPRC
jgi:antitoxin HigA-1